MFPREQIGRAAYVRVATERRPIRLHKGETEMSMTHGCVAQLFTDRFQPAVHLDAESSMERGRRAQIEAWSLKRLVGRLILRLRGQVKRDDAAELAAAVKRLSELSPHLLMDVGIDPATGQVADENVVLTLPRPVRAEVPAPVVQAAPVARPRRAPRLLLDIRVPVDTARPLGA